MRLRENLHGLPRQVGDVAFPEAENDAVRRVVEQATHFSGSASPMVSARPYPVLHGCGPFGWETLAF